MTMFLQPICVVISCLLMPVLSKDCFWNSPRIYKKFSSKTPYNCVRGDMRDSVVKIKGCEPISIWSLIRHGKRSPGIDFGNNMKEATAVRDYTVSSYEKGKCSLCAQDVENLKNWKDDQNLLGQTYGLTKEGKQEMYGIGKRIKETFSDLLANLDIGVAAVAGVFILLGVGMIVGCLILILEHLFYKYTLPILRHQPKGTIWRSRNIMFFSQKLYRFINCVELVSPHHAARELVNTIRQGHFTSLFQKSVKRKEHEQRRRRKSKAQFFEMIQEIRRVQQGRDHSLDSIKENVVVETSEFSEEVTESKFLSPSPDVPSHSPRCSRSPRLLRSPRSKRKRCSLAGLNVRRFSTDSVLGSDSASIYEKTSINIGRRLSRDVSFLTNSPPDINTRLRTPSPMVRRPEGSSTRSYQDMSDTSPNYLAIDAPSHRASVEIMVTQESDIPPTQSFSRISSLDAKSELSQLSEELLIRLWRSTEHEVKEAILAALQERRVSLEPKQEPG